MANGLLKIMLKTTLLLLLLLTPCAINAQTSVRWPVQQNYQLDDGFSDQTAITYTPTGSQAVAALYGNGGGNVPSRQSLAGDGSFSFKMTFAVSQSVTVGLDTSSSAVLPAAMDYAVSSNTNVTRNGSFVFDASPVTTTQTWTFRITGSIVTLERNGATVFTFSGTATQPLYLHLYTDSAGAGINTTTMTGASTIEPAAPPTCTATAGHRRNHIAITFPAGANGVEIYRSTVSGSENVEQPIVTEWRLPYYEDDNHLQGLTNGTAYFYKCRATVDGLSFSTASGETSASPAANTLPSISTGVALIVGSPQVQPIGDNTQNYWFDRLNEEQARYWGSTGPKRTEFESISGTVATVSGSKTVTGTSTSFLTDYRPDGFIKITSGGVERLYQVYWIASDTSLTLWTAYDGPNDPNCAHRPWWHVLQNDGYFAGFLHYYDLSLCIYHAYLRTGAPYLLHLFQENADAWHSWSQHERTVTGEDGYTSPRQAALGGMALRALDGQSSYWDIIEAYARAQYQVWIQNRINLQFFDNVRDASYVIQYAAILGKAHPDPAIRAEFTTKALNGLLNLFEWQMNKYADHQPRLDYFDAPVDRHYNWHQPFLDAIMGEAYIMVHKLTGNETIKSGFLQWISRTPEQFNTSLTSNGAIRTKFVFYELSNLVTPVSAPLLPPFYNAPYDTIPPNLSGYDINVISDGRFQNCITISNFGYAYYLTGLTAYKTAAGAADDRLSSSYGGSVAYPLPDGFSALPTIKFTGKNFNEAFRRGANYYAYANVITPLITGNGPKVMSGKARISGHATIR